MLLQEYLSNMKQTGSTGSRVEFISFLDELNKTIRLAERKYVNPGKSGIIKRIYQ